jgi:hypothetical protein
MQRQAQEVVTFPASNLSLSEDTLYRTWPTVAGFSFSAKCWGEIIVGNLREIQFDDDAYQNLVLEQDKKTLIQALVQDNSIAEKVTVLSSLIAHVYSHAMNCVWGNKIGFEENVH